MATTIRPITVPQKGSFIWISMTNNGHWVRNFLDFEPATPQAWIEYFTIVLPSLQTNANKVYSSIQSTVQVEMSVQRILMISQDKVSTWCPSVLAEFEDHKLVAEIVVCQKQYWRHVFFICFNSLPSTDLNVLFSDIFGHRWTFRLLLCSKIKTAIFYLVKW